MKMRRIITKFFTLFLTAALTAPQPAWALRSMNAGSEESPMISQIQSALQLAGSEEVLFSGSDLAEVGNYKRKDMPKQEEPESEGEPESETVILSRKEWFEKTAAPLSDWTL